MRFADLLDWEIKTSHNECVFDTSEHGDFVYKKNIMAILGKKSK